MIRANDPLARVTAVIVNYNSGRWLARCIDNLRGRGGRLPPVVVIDNASSDGSIELMPEQDNLVVRRARRNLGFGRGVNQALRCVNTEYLLIINPDCLIVPDALEQLILDLDQHPDAAMVSGRVFDMRGVEQRGSRRSLPTRRQVIAEVWPFSRGNGIDHSHEAVPDGPTDVEAVSGACMLARRCALDQIGGFDSDFYLHFEDLDVMARLRAAGWRIRLLPAVFIAHAGGISSRRRPLQVMWAKHRSLWRYLNKHCSEDWSWPSRTVWWLLIHLHALLRVPMSVIKRS